MKNVVEVFTEMGNPFTETSTDLLAIDTKIIIATEVIRSVREAEDIGKAQYKAFVDDRLINMTKPILDTIPKNNLNKQGEERNHPKQK